MSDFKKWLNRSSLWANGDLVALALASFAIGMAVSVLIELSVP